jgi:hypothetical protein
LVKRDGLPRCGILTHREGERFSLCYPKPLKRPD